MSERELCELLDGITPPDETAMEESRRHWDSLAKPLGSLGRLEAALTQIAGIQGSPGICIDKKALVIMCADNGVVAEGVSQCGPEVTAAVAENFFDRKSCVSLMCRQCGADLFPVDIGMQTDTPRVEKRKLAYGTKNMRYEPAMTRAQALAAISVGIEKVRRLKERGYQLVATGEMGIGNTTAASAMASVLLDVPVARVTGRGAGLGCAGLDRKIRVIEESIRLHRPDPADPMDVLAKIGGFDIAGMTGMFLGGALFHVPVVMDGMISAVAALTAVRLAPACADFIFASHLSEEPAAKLLLEALHKEALLTCGMRLGEGSGAVACFPLFDFAVEIYHNMPPFLEAGFAPYEWLE